MSSLVEECELRRDPLTGRSGRIAHFKGFTVVAPESSEQEAGSRLGCPFCPERISQVTPLLMPELTSEGRLRRGEATLFPNLSPYDRDSVVIALTAAHFVPLDQFTPRQVEDGIALAQEYFRLLGPRAEGETFLLTWNLMPQAGATQVHPHLQAFATDRAGALWEEEVRASRAYWERWGQSFWADLVQEEQRLGARFLARGDETVWLTAYVSRSVLSDLMVVMPKATSLDQLTPEGRRELASGLVAALGQLQAQGVRAFNLAIWGDAAATATLPTHANESRSLEPAPSTGVGTGAPIGAFVLHARLSPRVSLNPRVLGSDCTAWQQLLDEPFMVWPPETLCAKLRPAVAAAIEPSRGSGAPPAPEPGSRP